MAKAPVLTDLTSQYGTQATINDNYDAIQEAFENTLSRDGSTPNQMEADLDLNSNDILNVDNLDVGGTLSLDGTDILVALQGFEDDAEAFAAAAANSATAASGFASASASSATSAATSANLALATTGLADFDTVTALLDDNTILGYAGDGATLTVAAGDIVTAQGFRYEVAEDTATDNHVVTDGGVKLYCLRAADWSFNVLQFGAKGDNTTDDQPAFNTACSAFYKQDGAQSFVGRVWVPVPDDAYYFDSALNLKHNVELVGLGGAGTDNPRPVLMTFAADTNGIIVNSSLELDEALDPAGQTTTSSGSVLRGLSINSKGGTAYKHGVRLRSRCVIENCRVSNFPGHGIAVLANSGGDEYLRGNANNFKFQNCRITDCGYDGLYVDGGDANSGLVLGVDCSGNGRFGFFDESFLGNTYVGCHTNGNGTRPDITNITQANPAVITFSAAHPFTDGDRTFIENVVGMTEINNQTAIVTVIDSTSISVPINSTGYTAYTSGGRAFWGGAMLCEQANQRCLVLGQYHEPGQGYMYLSGRSQAILSHASVTLTGSGLYIKDSGIRNAKQISLDGNIESQLADNLAAMTFENVGEGGDVYRWSPDGEDWILTRNNSGDLMRLTSGNTVFTQPHMIAYRRFLLNNRRMDSETSVPTSGEYTRGDIIFNRNPSAGGKIGWVCTTSGTAGVDAVFKPWGAIDA